MHTWWSFMCTQLLYWRTNTTQTHSKWACERARDMQYRASKCVFIWFHHICTFCSDLSFVPYFLIFCSCCCFVFFHFLAACDKCTLLFCDALLKQMVPVGIILQTSSQKVKIGLFISPFLDGYFVALSLSLFLSLAWYYNYFLWHFGNIWY